VTIVIQSVRKSVDIERLLHWAYRDELPKTAIEGVWSSGGSPMFRFIGEGTRVDESMRDPGYPVIAGPPHPDAFVIEDAVNALDDERRPANSRHGYRVDWQRARKYLMGDLARLVSKRDKTLQDVRIGRAGLVATHASMGTRPDWGSVHPAPKPVLNANGRPLVVFQTESGVWVERRRKARSTGSRDHCKLVWDPEPRTIAFARIEYAVWIRALAELTIGLREKLEGHIALLPRAPIEPWKGST
jgi:hypothetical protein